jgi:hypothetical protein
MRRRSLATLVILLGLFGAMREPRAFLPAIPIVVLELEVAIPTLISAGAVAYEMVGVAIGARAAAFAKADEVWSTDPPGISEEAFRARSFPFAGGYLDPSETVTASATSLSGSEVTVQASSEWDLFRYQGEVTINPFKHGNEQSELLGAGFVRGGREMVIGRKIPGAASQGSGDAPREAPAPPHLDSPSEAPQKVGAPPAQQDVGGGEPEHIPLDITVRIPAMVLVRPPAGVSPTTEVTVVAKLDNTAGGGGERDGTTSDPTWQEFVFQAKVSLLENQDLEVHGDIDKIVFEKPYVDQEGNVVTFLPEKFEQTFRIMVPYRVDQAKPVRLILENEILLTPHKPS